ncbi:MAG TPA: thioredoxin family protein [Hanamia sp.]|nr:thioredoxin family protein [Hanamia sp.]
MKITKHFAIFLFLFFSITYASSQTKPASANQIIKEAKIDAAKTHKNIFVIFHASWCVWCHRMDTAMNDNSIKSFFDKNYVIKHLTVDESADKKNLENPGAPVLLTQYHGDQQGIPYWFIIDKNGKFLADSRLHSDDGKVTGNNVGCPVKPDEVAYFIRVLKQTSHLTNAQLDLIQKRFLKIGQ